jgi:hypothetical protein
MATGAHPLAMTGRRVTVRVEITGNAAIISRKVDILLAFYPLSLG